MTADPLLVDRTDGVVTLTLNRPESLNSLDVALKVALRDAVESLAADPACRAVVLTGAGRAFCVGQDLKEHVESLARRAGGCRWTPWWSTSTRWSGDWPRCPSRWWRRYGAWRPAPGRRWRCSPTSASADPRPAFLMAFANVGLAGDTGASWTLPRLVGHAKATELLMLAEPVGAEEALRLGLLTRLVGDRRRGAAGRAGAGRPAGRRPDRGVRADQARSCSSAASGTLDDALALEAEAQRICGATADHRNATAAFVAKEKPTFTGA